MGIAPKSQEPGTYRVVTGYRKVDDRRNRKYGKKVEVTIYVPKIKALECHNAGSSTPYQIMRAELERLLPQAKIVESYYYDGTYIVSLAAFFKAEKPSLIATDEAARAGLMSDDEFIARVKSIRDGAEIIYKNQARADEIYVQAGGLLDWYLGECESKSKAFVRYDERLQDLVTELRRVIDEKAAADLEWAKGEIVVLPAEDGYQPEAVELFLKHAVRYVRESKDYDPPLRRRRDRAQDAKYFLEKVEGREDSDE